MAVLPVMKTLFILPKAPATISFPEIPRYVPKPSSSLEQVGIQTTRPENPKRD